MKIKEEHLKGHNETWKIIITEVLKTLLWKIKIQKYQYS